MKMKQLGILVLALAMLVMAVTPALAKGPPGFGKLFYDGDVVRTVVPPATMSKEGIDTLYAFPNGGAEGQLPVTAVAPGDKEYHGGKWAFNAVTWNTDPYLITSADAVEAAAAAGDVTITRMPDKDFKCPVQP